MLNWLRRVFAPNVPHHPMAGLVFKTNQGFFEYQCKYGDTTITAKRPCFAIVRGDITSFATEVTNEPMADEHQRFFDLIVASPTGGHTQMVIHDIRKGALTNGDLVAWMPLSFSTTGGWFGQIIARCAPEFDDHGVVVLQYY